MKPNKTSDTQPDASPSAEAKDRMYKVQETCDLAIVFIADRLSADGIDAATLRGIVVGIDTTEFMTCSTQTPHELASLSLLTEMQATVIRQIEKEATEREEFMRVVSDAIAAVSAVDEAAQPGRGQTH